MSGKRGIRTPGTSPYFGFQDRRNRPLCHLSEKRVQRYYKKMEYANKIEKKSFLMLAKTFKGLESVLAQELIELGANEVQIERRAVSFKGDKALLYRANLCLRTAIRVLVPIKDERIKGLGI